MEEGMVLCETKAAANSCLPVAGESTAVSWRPRKTDARSPAVLRCRDRGEGGHGRRKGGIPQRSRALCVCKRAVMEQVGWLAVVGPCDPEVQRQVVFDLKVVTEVREGIPLPEGQIRVAGRDADTVRNISTESTPVPEPELAIQVRQELVR